MPINLDFIKSLDRLQIILKKRIYADKQGSHTASHGGEGLTFQDFKPYTPGDDFRYIDWKIYARTDRFFIKRFEAERNMVIHILVDSSASMNFGSKETTKFDYAAQVGLGFAYIAYKKNEKFNLSTFTEHVTALKPKKGSTNLAKTFDYMGAIRVEGKSDFLASMDEYRKHITSRSMIVFISDFLYDVEAVEEIISRYHKSQVFLIQVLDSRERDLDLQGDVILEDAETQTKMKTFISMRLKNTYQQKLEEHIAKLKDVSDHHGASFISVSTNTPIFEAFYHMFK